jgi:chitin-binding protein
VTREAIVLEWAAVERANGYVIERGAELSGPFEPAGRSDANRFADPGYQAGKTYAYRVRAIARGAAGEAEGPVSESVAITPRDVFAPDRPAGLRAVATETAVELSWEENAEPDLAGYRLRRSQPGVEPALIQDALITTPSYRDQGVARVATYLYAVTAVDNAGNESTPSDPVEVRVPD